MFVAIEGPDGVGKSTQVQELADRMRKASGRKVYTTREPTDSPLGAFIRAQHASLSPRGRALAVAADRADHLDRTVLPHLNSDGVVISDRYVPSSLVLQRLDGLSLEEIWRYNSFALRPTLTVILTADEKDVTQRLNARNELTYFEKLSTPRRQAELYEEAKLFLNLVGWDVISLNVASQSPLEAAERIISHIADKYPQINYNRN